MPLFKPTKEIQEIQKLQNTKLENVPASVIERVKTEIAQNVSAENPLISIVVIAYNEEDQILACVASLAKTICEYPVELIVVNNNSTDGTQQILDAVGVKNVLETKQGYGHARQAGLLTAKGAYVLTCDADTLYQPKWAEAMTKPLIEQKEVVETYSFGAYYSEDFKYGIGLLSYQAVKYLNFLLLHRKRPHLNIRGFSMGSRKADVLNVGGYANKEGRGEDGMLSFELSQIGKIVLVKENGATVFTSSRGVLIDGSLGKGFVKRAKDNLRYLHNYFTTHKPE